MRYFRFLGTLDENMNINNGVLVDADKISYFSNGEKIASVSVNNPKCLSFPALHTEMRGKFISAASDGEICANGVKRALKTGEIAVDEFAKTDGFTLNEAVIQNSLQIKNKKKSFCRI